MYAMLAGWILVVLILFILWLLAAPIFSKIGELIYKIFKPFKSEEVKNELGENDNE